MRGTGPAAALFAIGLSVVAGGCGASGPSAANADPAAVDRVANWACPAAASSVGAARPGPKAGRLQVVTTVAPITSIAANVAGERADVRGVIPEGSDSHTFEPKPSAAEFFARADVVVVNGLSLEEPTKQLAARNIPGKKMLCG